MYKKENCAIAIPVYKPEMKEMEKKSFVQCMRVLASRDIYIFTHQELDLRQYRRLAEKEGVKIKILFFDKSFFDSIDSYNSLMLDKRFYNTFSKYSYLLIYQLDAYVFNDNLDYWCLQGYDYVGAPWFDRFETADEGNLFTVGNGGFSLRRIAYFTKLLTSHKWIFGFQSLPTGRGLITRLKFILGGYNNIASIIEHNTHNEDYFYCITLSNSRYAPHLPSPEKAAAFAFERSPSYLYRLIGRMPMGCHAFEKNEYDTFWCDKIK